MPTSQRFTRQSESWVVFLSTYPPRECGIATFTKHLTDAIDRHSPSWLKTKVVAIRRSKTKYHIYPKKVINEVVEGDREGYMRIAQELNANAKVRLVIVEHEFGLFGGNTGDALMAFYDALEKPVFTTAHTVLPSPQPAYLSGLQAVAHASTRMIAVNSTASSLLQSVYGVPKDHILVLPHGVPTVALHDVAQAKKRFGFIDRIVISTFGLLNPDKGIEVVLEALPPIVKEFPEVVYFIVGETHPNIVEWYGEGYRQSLMQQVETLGLSDHVRFVPQYLTEKELIQYLLATDVYINASQNPDQIVSGTLSYAIGVGNAVISTPFLHAKEFESLGLCLLADFQEPQSFADPLRELLASPKKREELSHAAYDGSRFMTWSNVALAYLREWTEYLPAQRNVVDTLPPLPTVRLGHLFRLSDSFGVIQFAHRTIPDSSSGYCVDDVCRALLALAMHWSSYKKQSVFARMQIYLNFIEFVQGEDGWFHNFVDIERRVNTTDMSSDAHARTLWALGFVMSRPGLPQAMRDHAARLFRYAMQTLPMLKSLRTISFAIAGLYYANKADHSSVLLKELTRFADQLVAAYDEHEHEQWQWFEDELTYSNSKLPEALLYAYAATKQKRYREVAETTLNFLRDETLYDGVFHPIGQAGWYARGKTRAQFDQQPIDVASMVRTLIVAHRITRKQVYWNEALQTYHWFTGRNAISQMVYDPVTGGCHDGLQESGVNLNEGAESTIVHLMARLAVDSRTVLL